MNQECVHEGLIQTANTADRQHKPQTVAKIDAIVETMRQPGRKPEKFLLPTFTNLTPLIDCTYFHSVLSHF